MQSWWLNEIDGLIALSQKTSPLYVYHLPTIERNFLKLKNLKSVQGIFFAMKANPHPDIIRLIDNLGGGFDCVSRYELELVRRYASKAKAIFTANFAPLNEYEFALNCPDTFVTVDNLGLIKQHPDLFTGRQIFLRLDPDYTDGHHPYVKTAGKLAKFGILIEDFQKCLELCRKHSIKIIGLHAHVGSGIKNVDSWNRCARFLISCASEIPSVEYLDIGGGLPAADDISFNLTEIDISLSWLKKDYPKYKLIIEPGRFLVANAGIILSLLTQVKQKGDRIYVGLDAGMNTLIRPALYAAKHSVYNLSAFHQKETMKVDIVGPICESADILARDVEIPISKEGDTFLIDHAGAYGHCMSSTYNSRPLALEYIWN